MCGQYRMVNSDRSEELVERPRVMAAVWGPGSPATALAMLDEAGQLVAFMFAGALSGPLRAPHPNDPPLFHEANRKARCWAPHPLAPPGRLIAAGVHGCYRHPVPSGSMRKGARAPVKVTATKDFFKQRSYFGLDPSQVVFFQQVSATLLQHSLP